MNPRVMLVTIKWNNAGRFSRKQAVMGTLKTADGWWHNDETFWLLVDGKPPAYWARAVRTHMMDQDAVMVATIHLSDVHGWLTNDVWAWLRRNGITD